MPATVPRPWPASPGEHDLDRSQWGLFAPAIYGAASLVQHALMVIGATPTPLALGSEAARWHLVLWDPWWIIGGVLFVLAARR